MAVRASSEACVGWQRAARGASRCTGLFV